MSQKTKIPDKRKEHVVHWLETQETGQRINHGNQESHQDPNLKLKQTAENSAPEGAPVLDRQSSTTSSFQTLREKFLNAAPPAIPDSLEESRAATTDDDKGQPQQVKKQKQKQKKKKKQAQVLFDGSTYEENEAKRIQELEKKHMQILNDLERLRQHYYHEYMTALEDKVKDQRAQIRKRSEKHDRKLLFLAEQKKRQSHRLKTRFQKSELTHDASYLKKIPKTQLFKIIHLQDQMMRDGKMVTQTERDHFWHNIRQPQQFQKIFGKETSGTDDNEEEGGRSVSSVPSRSLKLDKHAAGTSQRQGQGEPPEAREGQGEGSSPASHLWAITQRPKKNVKSTQSSLLTKRVRGRKVNAHPKALEMEQRFPRIEIPRMASINFNLEPDKEDPEVVRMREEFWQRSLLRDVEKQRVRRMYQHALTHQAATQRILSKKEDEFSPEGSNVRELFGAMETLLWEEAGGPADGPDQAQAPHPGYSPDQAHPGYSPDQAQPGGAQAQAGGAQAGAGRGPPPGIQPEMLSAMDRLSVGWAYQPPSSIAGWAGGVPALPPPHHPHRPADRLAGQHHGTASTRSQQGRHTPPPPPSPAAAIDPVGSFPWQMGALPRFSRNNDDESVGSRNSSPVLPQQPLTMDTVGGKIMESKCLSSFWSNYATKDLKAA